MGSVFLEFVFRIINKSLFSNRPAQRCTKNRGDFFKPLQKVKSKGVNLLFRLTHRTKTKEIKLGFQTRLATDAAIGILQLSPQHIECICRAALCDFHLR